MPTFINSFFEKLHAPSLIVTAFLSAVATVIALESQDKIKHSEHKEDYALSEYRAVLIETDDEGSYRVSHKPSNQHASCHDGFLFIRSDVNQAMQGVVVDYKNRGIRCRDDDLANK